MKLKSHFGVITENSEIIYETAQFITKSNVLFISSAASYGCLKWGSSIFVLTTDFLTTHCSSLTLH